MDEAPDSRRSRLELLLDEAAGGKSERLFALFDAARIPGLPALLRGLGIAHDCLFRGELPPRYGQYWANRSMPSLPICWRCA